MQGAVKARRARRNDLSSLRDANLIDVTEHPLGVGMSQVMEGTNPANPANLVVHFGV